MIINRKIYKKWTSRNRKHFESKGYIFSKKGDKFLVNILDLQPSSKIRVKVNCDYCNSIYETSFHKYRLRVIDAEYCKKACCKKCIGKKFKEVFKLKHGVNNPSELKNVVNKRNKTFIERYGGNPSKLNSIKEKKKLTLLKNYGVENPMFCPILKEKAQVNKKSGVFSSKGQNYLNTIVNGKLNYKVGFYFLDIAFPKEKIYIEYDGSGHNLCVKYNQMTLEEFLNKESIRYFYLKKQGWKMIRIVSIKDRLPDKNKILQILEISKTILKLDNWIIFDIEQKSIYSLSFYGSFDYGYIKNTKLWLI